MSGPYDVIQIGTDTSGRAILMNRRMKQAFDVVCDRIGFRPTIVQGAYMARVGGGADDSAGTHDAGGCIDTRTWDIDSDEERAVIRHGRSVGWMIYRRDQRHGMDEHMHWGLLGDRDASPDTRWQFDEYRAGRDALASQGPDYHWRPDPIPTYDYQEDWFEMATKAELRDVVDNALAAEREALVQAVKRELLHGSDIFPNDNSKNVSVNDVLARLYNA